VSVCLELNFLEYNNLNKDCLLNHCDKSSRFISKFNRKLVFYVLCGFSWINNKFTKCDITEISFLKKLTSTKFVEARRKLGPSLLRVL